MRPGLNIQYSEYSQYLRELNMSWSQSVIGRIAASSSATVGQRLHVAALLVVGGWVVYYSGYCSGWVVYYSGYCSGWGVYHTDWGVYHTDWVVYFSSWVVYYDGRVAYYSGRVVYHGGWVFYYNGRVFADL